MRSAETGTEPRAATPADAFRAAVRAFIRGPRLDMGRLADELSISKATLYRWTGPRDQLLADLLTYLSQNTFKDALARTEQLEGAERFLAAMRLYVEQLASFAPLRHFIQTETPLALRLLTQRGSLPQSDALQMITELLTFEHNVHGMPLRAPADTLAYAITRMTEGFIYNDPVAGIEPDVDAAIHITGLLLIA